MPQAARGETSRGIIGGIAVTCLIMGIAVFIPVVGFFFALFLPAALLFYRLKLGRGNAAVVAAVTAVIMTGGGSGGIDRIFFGGLMLIGFALAECMERNLSVEKTVLYPTGVVIGAGLLGLAAYSHSLQTGFFTLVADYVSRNMEMTVALYENMGMPQQEIQLITGSLKRIEYIFVRIIPALVIAMTLVVTWMNLLIARPILRRKEMVAGDFGPLNQWRSPEILVWGVILCCLGMLLAGQTLRLLAANGFIVFLVVYFFQGIAIVSFYFEKKQLPRPARVFLYALIVLQQLLVLLIAGIGFFDVWLNFRRLGMEKPVG
ncbi:MAG: YybS family protein [Thermodesulfobacteriota bacterium]